MDRETQRADSPWGDKRVGYYLVTKQEQHISETIFKLTIFQYFLILQKKKV